MIHYIKSVTGVEYTPSYITHLGYEGIELYAEPFQKYKEWHFFIIILLPYFKTKIAKENLYCHIGSFPFKDDLYNAEYLKSRYHLIEKDGHLWKQAKVHVTLSDGTSETVWFDTNDEAEENVKGIVEDWNLKRYFDLNTFKYTENKED
jgi:hypothetical protein